MMRRISTEKMMKANKVVVTQCEAVAKPWWKFWGKKPELRMVTRVLKDRDTGNHCVLSTRRMTVFETTLFEEGDMHSYTIDYPPGVGCHGH